MPDSHALRDPTTRAPRLAPRAGGPQTVSPLSFAQERIWFVDRLWGASRIYNIAVAFALTGPLNRAAFARSCDELVRRHESLRTRVEVRHGEPVQLIDPPAPCRIRTEDLTHLPVEERRAEIERHIGEEAADPFDLTTGRLFRVRLLRVASIEHVLLLSIHHFIADGWSIRVLRRDLAALYEAYAQGRESPLPPLPMQYADYAVWQRQWLQGETIERQLRYWTARLAGAPPVLDLPADRPRPALRTHRTATSRFTLSDALSERVHQMARRERSTPFMVLLAAYQILLSRWSGQDDIVVGMPIAGRSDRRLEDLVGCFVNTLALRTDLSGRPSFTGVLRQVRQVALGAFAQQDLPFDRLVHALQPRRDAAHEPIVQVMMIEARDQAGALAFGDLAMTRVPTPAFSPTDLTLHVNSSSDVIRGSLSYVTDLFDAETIQARIAQLTETLAQVTQHPEAPIRTLSLLPPGERAQLVTGWNATHADDSDVDCLEQLFEAQAARTPDAIAVVDATQSVTYAALASRARALARQLRAEPLGPEARVALCLERRAEMLIAILAVLEAGGAYVPIDPAWPAERIRRILDESRPEVILTESGLRATIPATASAARTIELDAAPAPWPPARASASRARRLDTLDRAAYVMYTSGSTGMPNGVVVEHRGVVNIMRAMRDLVGLTAADRVLSVTTIAFDIAVVELLLPLMAGARTTIVERREAIDPAALDAAIRRHDIDVMQATPMTWRMLIDRGWEGNSTLRAICGGEALPVELAARLQPRVARLWNVYGPTETTVWSTMHPVDTGSLDAPGYVSIGGPLRNNSIYILDAAGQLAPIGVPGELHIGGEGVARAYLNQPGKTAQRFLPDPFGAKAGARIYRTGDVGRRRRDGTIEFMGRNDSQVKVHGFRIELGDVESHLKAHALVRDAVVVVREDAPGQRRLVAYYVMDEDAPRHAPEQEQDTPGLRQYLASHLPEYMIPGAFVRLEAMPLTANGKVNRQALPTPVREDLAGPGFEPPCGDIEDALAGMWARVLNLDRVGRHDDFFEIGGDSLSALRVVTSIETELAARLPVIIMFSARTVAELAEHVAAEAHAGAHAV